MYCEVLSCEVKKDCMLKECSSNNTSFKNNCLIVENRERDLTISDLKELLGNESVTYYQQGISKVTINILKEMLHTTYLPSVYVGKLCVETHKKCKNYTKLNNNLKLSDDSILPKELWNFVINLQVRMEDFLEFVRNQFFDLSTLEKVIGIKQLSDYLDSDIQGENVCR